jgi:hypothetical protein
MVLRLAVAAGVGLLLTLGSLAATDTIRTDETGKGPPPGTSVVLRGAPLTWLLQVDAGRRGVDTAEEARSFVLRTYLDDQNFTGPVSVGNLIVDWLTWSLAAFAVISVASLLVATRRQSDPPGAPR